MNNLTLFLQSQSSVLILATTTKMLWQFRKAKDNLDGLKFPSILKVANTWKPIACQHSGQRTQLWYCSIISNSKQIDNKLVLNSTGLKLIWWYMPLEKKTANIQHWRVISSCNCFLRSY